ncbi:MAG: formylmethanofuran dehydrogenase [Methylotenera sp.]
MKNISLKSNQCIATCPACGLLCDDILVENNQNVIKVMANGCAKSIAFFEQPLHDATPQIAGEPASLAQALAKAAQILKEAKQPLFTGLSTDVAGFRAIYNLAQKSNASLQHMNAASTARNIKVLQSTGWQTTTLTEVKNRADVIACIGSDIVSHNPRFFERFVDVDGMFISAKNRQLIVLGESKNNGVIKSDALEAAWILPCRADDLPSVTIALRALVAGKPLKATEVAGIKVSDLQSVADKLKAAKYAVLAWVSKDFDYPHAELTIQNITETVAILNQTTRAAGLALGGSDGDTSANNANTWLSGFALNNDTIEHDCVVWVNSFNAEKLPPNTDKPLIVLGNTNCQFETTPDVFIPIAKPGLDCSGMLFRVDSSVTLPLKKLRENNLPTLSEVVSGIEALL